jgi:hypothetical protein
LSASTKIFGVGCRSPGSSASAPLEHAPQRIDRRRRPAA